jgi:hypothetical protein
MDDLIHQAQLLGVPWRPKRPLSGTKDAESLIQCAQQQSLSCAYRIAAIQEELLLLERQKQALDDLVNRASCVATRSQALISRLPDEILLEVFSHFAEYNELIIELDGLHWIVPAKPLLLVCRRWKRIALSTPLLWKGIKIGDSTIPNPPTSVIPRMNTSIYNLLLLLLHRSGQSNLDLHIVMGWTANGMSLLIDLLRSYSHRWGSAHIEDSSWIGGSSVLPEDIPNLTHITLKAERTNLQALARSARNLRSVRLIGFDGFLWPEDLVFSHVTRVDLETTGWWHALRMFPNVAELTLHATLELRIPEPPFVLPPSCRSFVLASIDFKYDLTRVLGRLEAPSLERLALTSRKAGTSSDPTRASIELPIDAVESFVRKSGCHLAQLSLDGIVLSKHHLHLLQSALGMDKPRVSWNKIVPGNYIEGLVIRSIPS